jgi:hypothetical protein
MRTLENRLDSIESNVCDFYSDNPRLDGSNVDVGVALVGFRTETGKKRAVNRTVGPQTLMPNQRVSNLSGRH